MGAIPEIDALDKRDYADLRKLNDALRNDIDNGELWIQIADAAEKPDGDDLTRNSDSQVLQAYRGTMNALLAKYPLFFGYWMRYAGWEWRIAGTEQAEFVGFADYTMGRRLMLTLIQGLRARCRCQPSHRSALARISHIQDG